MPNLLAMSFEGALTPAFDLHCLNPGRTIPDGWGIACYPGGEPGARSLGEVPPETLLGWFHDLNQFGSLTTALSDGADLVVYADRRGEGEAHVWELLPPHGPLAFGDRDLTVDLTRRGVHGRK